MRKIFLSAGHSNVAGRDRGAVGYGYIEGIETVRIRKRLAEILKQKYNINAIVDSDDSILSQTLNYFRNKTSPNCIVIDIHFNAATPLATGTETFVPSDASLFELHLARALSHAAHTRLGIPKRGNFRTFAGVKAESESHHGRLGWMRLTGENALIEVCFISNKNDMNKYEMHFENYCQDLAITLFHFATNNFTYLSNGIR